MCAYLFERRRIYLVLAATGFSAALLTRIDTLALCLPVLLFTLSMLSRRDGRNALLFAALCGAGLGFWLLHSATIDAPYVTASLQLFSSYVFGFLKYWQELALAATAATVLIGCGVYRYSRPLMTAARSVLDQRVTRIAFYVLLPAAALYVYWGQPGLPGLSARGARVDILARLGDYLTPLLLVMAVAGALACFRRGLRAADGLLLSFCLLFSGLFLTRYTSAAVYPVALRRLLPEVIPALVIFGSYGMVSLPNWPAFRRFNRRLIYAGQFALVAATVVGMFAVSWPFLFVRESAGATEFVGNLAGLFPKDSVIVFEPMSEKSLLGWLSVPLWSIYDRNALLLVKEPEHPEQLCRIFAGWQAETRAVFYVSQQQPAPLCAPSQTMRLAYQTIWDSTIIGQSATYFPPFIWHFAAPVNIYEVRASDGS
jgi:hypothetical protein